MTDNKQTSVTQADRPRYLLMKRDLYYGPNNRGYTGIKDKAGRYFETDAAPDCDVTAIHEDDAPEFAKARFDDLARDHLQNKITTQAAEIERLRELLGRAAKSLERNLYRQEEKLEWIAPAIRAALSIQASEQEPNQ